MSRYYVADQWRLVMLVSPNDLLNDDQS